MSTVLAPPPAHAHTGPAGRIAELPAERFLVLLLAIAAAAAALGATGLARLADLRARHFVAVAKNAAASPVDYGARIASLEKIVGAPAAPGLLAVVRADSALGDERGGLCTLARQGVAGVRWIALSDDVDPCVRDALGARLAPAYARAGNARREMKDARWLLVDARLRAA